MLYSSAIANDLRNIVCYLRNIVRYLRNIILQLSGFCTSD